MLCLILIVGGLLIKRGKHDRSEALCYYFRLEDQVPETHLLRLIEKHISFAFVRERLKATYSPLAGFRSRWRIWRECAAARPAQICCAFSFALTTGNLPVRRSSEARSSPSTYSIDKEVGPGRDRRCRRRGTHWGE